MRITQVGQDTRLHPLHMLNAWERKRAGQVGGNDCHPSETSAKVIGGYMMIPLFP